MARQRVTRGCGDGAPVAIPVRVRKRTPRASSSPLPPRCRIEVNMSLRAIGPTLSETPATRASRAQAARTPVLRVLARAAALGPVLVCGPALLTAQHPAPAAPAASHHPDPGHAGHAGPAATPSAAPPSAFGGPQARLASARAGRAPVVAEQNGVRVAFAASAVAGGPVVAGREATLGVTLAHAGSGTPFGGLEIAAWIDRREAPAARPPTPARRRSTSSCRPGSRWRARCARSRSRISTAT
jgi:hypothetical protein